MKGRVKMSSFEVVAEVVVCIGADPVGWVWGGDTTHDLPFTSYPHSMGRHQLSRCPWGKGQNGWEEVGWGRAWDGAGVEHPPRNQKVSASGHVFRHRA